MVLADDFTHRHIEGVLTHDRAHHTLATVIASINTGDIWKTRAGGYQETIKVTTECPHSGCNVAPYIATNQTSPRKDNLEKLDLC